MQDVGRYFDSGFCLPRSLFLGISLLRRGFLFILDGQDGFLLQIAGHVETGIGHVLQQLPFEAADTGEFVMCFRQLLLQFLVIGLQRAGLHEEFVHRLQLLVKVKGGGMYARLDGGVCGIVCRGIYQAGVLQGELLRHVHHLLLELLQHLLVALQLLRV